MVARLASIAERYQKVAGSSPAVVTFLFYFPFNERNFKISKFQNLSGLGAQRSAPTKRA